MRFIKIILVLVCLSVAAGFYLLGPQYVRAVGHLIYGTPHQQYAAWLRLSPTGRTAAGRAWLDAAGQSLRRPSPLSLPTALEFGGGAAAFEADLRRGERYRIRLEPAAGRGADNLFVDLFRRVDTRFEHVASAGVAERALDAEIRRDGSYVLRVQRPLGATAAQLSEGLVTLTLTAEPSLMLPVQRASRRSIQSFFGAARDGGRRSHQGIDIFAARGTPVLAASDGLVVSVGTNGLGGKVVWIADPKHGERHYYAHLDQQFVSVGSVVSAGDVIGTVGNTGNARSTPPHLHFGIYAIGGAVDPLPYVDPGRAVAGRLASGGGAATRAR